MTPEAVELAKIASAWAHVHQALTELEGRWSPGELRARAAAHRAAGELVELYRAKSAAARPAPVEPHGVRRTGGIA